MIKRISTIFLSALLIAGLTGCGKKATKEPAAPVLENPTAASAYPADTVLFSSSALSENPFNERFQLFAQEVYTALDLSDAQLAEAETFRKAIKSMSIGIGNVTLAPFSIEAGCVLNADFTDDQIEKIKESYTANLTETEPLNGFSVYTHTFTNPSAQKSPLAGISQAVFITLPKDGKVVVATNRTYIEFMLSESTTPRNSLASDPEYQQMLATLADGEQTTISFMRTQQYLDLLSDNISIIQKELTKGKPIPISIEKIVKTLMKNLGLQDWGNSIATWDAAKNIGISHMMMNPTNSLYTQFTFTEPMILPHVPADATQVIIWNPNDSEKGFIDFVSAINETAKLFLPPVMGEPVTLAENAGGFKFYTLAENLSGPISLWQNTDTTNPKNQKLCIQLGLQDAAAFQEFLFAIPALAPFKSIEPDDGIYSIKDSISWAFKDQSFYISSSAAYLKQSLDMSTPSLFDSPKFKKMIQQNGDNYTVLQYADYASLIQQSTSQIKGDAQQKNLLNAYMNLFSHMTLLQTSTAKEGLFVSQTQLDF